MASRLGKGWKPTPPHLRSTFAAPPAHLFAIGDLPDVIDIALPPPLDQGPTSSCVAHSTAIALSTSIAHMQALPAGQFPELPSRLFIYFYARSRTGDLWLDAQETIPNDGGCFIHDAFGVFADQGFPPESAWPFNPESDSGQILLNVKPDAVEHLRLAADQRVAMGLSGDDAVKSYRLASSGAARVDEVERLLATNHLIVWGTQLDQAFEDLSPSQIWQGVLGPDVGGHAMVLHRRQFYDSKRRRKFGTRSSWGDWCDGGSAWVDEDAIASASADDFWALKLAPAYSGTV